MADEWELAATQRRAYADMVESLSPDQLEASTLCANWNVHEVTGHLVTFVDISMPKFMFNIAMSGFNYDKAADKMAKNMAERPIADLLASLREKAGQKSAMSSFPESMTVTDVTVHTQDVRRALELDGAPSDESVRTSLDFLTGHKQAKNIIDPKRIEGLRLAATDLDWSWGSGAAVEGPAESILMAVSGRPTYAELTGDGVSRLKG